MLRLLKFLLLHFASKQLVVSEKFCFHKRHHKEGGWLWHRVSPVDSEVFQILLSLTAWLEEGVKLYHTAAIPKSQLCETANCGRGFLAAAEALALCRPTKLGRQQWSLLQGVRCWGICPVLVVPPSNQKAERVFRAEKHPWNSDVSSSKTKQ